MTPCPFTGTGDRQGPFVITDICVDGSQMARLIRYSQLKYGAKPIRIWPRVSRVFYVSRGLFHPTTALPPSSSFCGYNVTSTTRQQGCSNIVEACLIASLNFAGSALCCVSHRSSFRLVKQPIEITMPIRNPFARRQDVHTGLSPAEENAPQNGAKPAFEKVDTMGSKSSAMSIKSGNSQEPTEYKMSGMCSYAFSTA